VFSYDNPGYWVSAYILFFFFGMITAFLVHRIEEWHASCELAAQQAKRYAKLRDLEDQEDLEVGKQKAWSLPRLPDCLDGDDKEGRAQKKKSAEPQWKDDEEQDEQKPLLGKDTLTARARLGTWLRQGLLSHRGRGITADVCALSLLVPLLAVPLPYTLVSQRYVPSYMWGDWANWRFAFGPVFCLFLFGSASKGGAGKVAAFFSFDALVSLGDISLAAYCFQTTVASLCGVKGSSYLRFNVWLADRARCIKLIASLKEQGKQAELDASCLQTPTDLFAMMLLILYVSAAIYTLVIEGRLVRLVRWAASRCTALLLRVKARSYMHSTEHRDD